MAAFVSLGAVLISTIGFILSTIPELHDQEQDEEDPQSPSDNENITTTTPLPELPEIDMGSYIVNVWSVLFTCSVQLIGIVFVAETK